MTKGEAFELKVKEMIDYMLKQGELALIPEYVKTFHRKGYYSNDRKKDIIMDVSIEVFRKNNETPFLVWIWECKDYGKPVPVDDVEEFHSKLEQIGLHKTKGTMISTFGFQQGAIDYAESKGIGLARVLPEDAVSMILESVQMGSREQVIHGLTEQDTLSICSWYHGLTSSRIPVVELHDHILYEIRESN